MILINDEELQQLDAECGVTIHNSVDALSAYELNCIKPDIRMSPIYFTVQTVTKQSYDTVQEYY